MSHKRNNYRHKNHMRRGLDGITEYTEERLANMTLQELAVVCKETYDTLNDNGWRIQLHNAPLDARAILDDVQKFTVFHPIIMPVRVMLAQHELMSLAHHLNHGRRAKPDAYRDWLLEHEIAA